jgi:hypothetical protein
VTTPTQESVRRALAIQLIIDKEWGLTMTENPLQGSFIVEELTDLLEEAVLAELDRISERGGVLGAMETGYQRGRIQDDSMLYEHKNHDGSQPIVGVNTFVGPTKDGPADREVALEALRKTAFNRGNVFAELMSTVRNATLGDHQQPVRCRRILPSQRLMDGFATTPDVTPRTINLLNAAGLTDYQAPVAEILLALDVAGLGDVLQLLQFSNIDRGTIDLAITEFGRFASEVVGPTDRSGDLKGFVLHAGTGEVRTPTGVSTTWLATLSIWCWPEPQRLRQGRRGSLSFWYRR